MDQSGRRTRCVQAVILASSAAPHASSSADVLAAGVVYTRRYPGGGEQQTQRMVKVLRPTYRAFRNCQEPGVHHRGVGVGSHYRVLGMIREGTGGVEGKARLKSSGRRRARSRWCGLMSLDPARCMFQSLDERGCRCPFLRRCFTLHGGHLVPCITDSVVCLALSAYRAAAGLCRCLHICRRRVSDVFSVCSHWEEGGISRGGRRTHAHPHRTTGFSWNSGWPTKHRPICHAWHHPRVSRHIPDGQTRCERSQLPSFSTAV